MQKDGEVVKLEKKRKKSKTISVNCQAKTRSIYSAEKKKQIEEHTIVAITKLIRDSIAYQCDQLGRKRCLGRKAKAKE